MDWITYEEAAREPEKYRVALKIAKPGEMIPRSAALLYDRELTEADIARAHELAERYGWDVGESIDSGELTARDIVVGQEMIEEYEASKDQWEGDKWQR